MRFWQLNIAGDPAYIAATTDEAVAADLAAPHHKSLILFAQVFPGEQDNHRLLAIGALFHAARERYPIREIRVFEVTAAPARVEDERQGINHDVPVWRLTSD